MLGQAWGENDNAIRQRIGVSLQETQLSERLTVEETISLFRSFYDSGMDSGRAIARVSLEEKARSFVKTLSGGQNQRLALACALVGDPDLLFLDEPTTGLDPQSRRQVWETISKFRQQQRTILLTTHYMEEAERLCDRVAIVDHGQVIALGTPSELIASLGGEHVIEFTLLGEENHEPQVREALADAPSVRQLSRNGRDFCVSTTEPHVALPPLMDRLRNRHLTLASLSIRHASLDDVFVRLAGRHLDDDESQDAGDRDADSPYAGTAGDRAAG